ncbi:hypothetical protein J0H33_05965 [bacterium]|nr:hypothetical protein [bacterium]
MGTTDRVIIVIASLGAVAFAVALAAHTMEPRSDTDASPPAGVQWNAETPTATPPARAIA